MRHLNYTAKMLKAVGISSHRARRLLNNEPDAALTLWELQELGIEIPLIQPEPPPQPESEPLPKFRKRAQPKFTNVEPNGKALLHYKTRRRLVWTDPKLSDMSDKLRDLFQFVRQGETALYMSHTDRLLARKLKTTLEKIFKEDYGIFYEQFTGSVSEESRIESQE